VADGPALLVVGAVTRDIIGGQVVPGGAASYAARAAAALGLRAAIVTVAADDANLEALVGHDVQIVHAQATLTFEHARAADGSRALRVLARPERALNWDDVPERWRAPGVLLLAPLLADDVDIESFAACPAPVRGLLAQGLQRRVVADGAVEQLDAPSAALLAALAPAEVAARTTVFLSAEEMRGWSTTARDALAARCARLVVTQGAAGALVYAGGGELAIAAALADAIDATGAGDVFATAFILRLDAGDAAAGRLASALASAAVERRGPAPLPTRAELEQRWRDADEAEPGRR
jgi:sugar/nucleoside kinase (ribokinase family)